MRSLSEQFPVTDDTDFDPDFFNPLIREIGVQLGELQILKEGLEGAFKGAEDIALERINVILGPAISEINAKIAIVNQLVSLAQTELQNATAEAVALVQPLINVAMAAVIAATTSANNAAGVAIAAAATANQTAVAYANEARRVTYFTRRLAG